MSLQRLMKDEIRIARREVREVRNAFPVKGVLGVVIMLVMMAIVGLVIIEVSLEGDVSMKKEQMGFGAGANFKVSMPENITKVVDIVLPHPPVSSTSTTTSTTQTSSTTTSTTLKIIYGVAHDATAGGWYDPSTGVGSVPSGNDPGACGRGGLGR